MLSVVCNARFGVLFSSVCSAANIHLILLDRVVSASQWFRFFTGCVCECDIAHRRSVEVLLCYIRSGVIRCTLFVPYVFDIMRASHGEGAYLYCMRHVPSLCLYCMRQCGPHPVLRLNISIIMGLFAAEPRSIAGLLFPSQWNDLADVAFDDEGLAGFKSRANAFLFA